MRILHLHSFYSSSRTSGENDYVSQLQSFLKQSHTVHTYFPQIQEKNLTLVGKIRLGISFLTLNPLFIAKALRVDLVVYHNRIPKVSFVSLFIISLFKPVVRVWHNHRPMCLNGLEFRNGLECQLCSKGYLSKLASVRYRCYRKSLLHSILLFLSEYSFNKRILRKQFHVVSSQYMLRRLINLEIPQNRITLIPGVINKSIESFHNHKLSSKPKRDFVFHGRVGDEKGANLLIRSWISLPLASKEGRTLHMVGAVDESSFKQYVTQDDIKFHGHLEGLELYRILSMCSVSCLPSLVKETFGRSGAEALSLGMRLIVSNRGALPEFVQDNTFGQVLLKLDETSLTEAIKAEFDVDFEVGRELRELTGFKFRREQWEKSWEEFIENL